MKFYIDFQIAMLHNNIFFIKTYSTYIKIKICYHLHEKLYEIHTEKFSD